MVANTIQHGNYVNQRCHREDRRNIARCDRKAWLDGDRESIAATASSNFILQRYLSSASSVFPSKPTSPAEEAVGLDIIPEDMQERAMGLPYRTNGGAAIPEGSRMLRLGKGVGTDTELDGYLLTAAYEGKGHVVQMLLENGADINAQGGEYGNALLGAVCGGHETVIQMLLEEGADVNAQGRYFTSSYSPQQ